MDQHERDANEAVAINAVNRRLTAIGRTNWGIVEVSAKHAIVSALSEVVADKVAPAYAELANVDAPKQEPSETLENVNIEFNRERAA